MYPGRDQPADDHNDEETGRRRAHLPRGPRPGPVLFGVGVFGADPPHDSPTLVSALLSADSPI